MKKYCVKKYAVWIGPGFDAGEVEAESVDEARRIFAAMVKGSLDETHVEAEEIEVDAENKA